MTARLRVWLLLACAASAAPAAAGDPVVRHHGRFADFEAGTGDGVRLRSDGQLSLGPVLQPLAEIDAERIWRLATAGDDVWAGTGDDGRIYHLAGGQPPRLLFDSPEIGVHALLVDGGALYAGTSPDGLVYRVDADGEATTMARSGSRYVWDLAGHPGGGLVAATGAPARVLRVAGSRVDTLFEASGDGHIRALAWAGRRLYAGTAVAGGSPEADATRRARIYEVDGGRLVVETDAEEITHLLAVVDTLFAALVSGAPPGQGASADDARSSLLRVDPGGGSYPLWQGPGTWAGLVAGDGWLTAVLRDPARVLRVRTDGRLHERVADADSLEPNAVARLGADWVVGDGRTGRLSRLTSAAVDSGTFDARVEDLGGHSHWGALEWEATVPEKARLRLRTRSGNTPEPDLTWSPWSAALTRSGSAIPSPPARYLQYRLLLSAPDPASSPTVRRVSFTARQTNLPPRIGELTTFAYRGNGQGQGPPQPPSNGGRNNNRQLPQSKSLRVVRWQAEDANGDELSFRVYLRGEDQRDWKLVEEDLEQTSVIWDTESMPEGITQLRIVATDAPDNPPGQALEHDVVSEPFPIDNSPPRVQLKLERRDGERVVAVVMEDAVTAVLGARYSVDYDDVGTRLAPADGVFDSRRETATFRLGDLAPGEHVISVQAWDALDNVGVARLLVDVE